MKYIDINSKPVVDSTPITLVIGKFDGIHKGHQELIKVARDYRDGLLSVMSFSEHPLWVLREDPEYISSLTPLKTKLDILQTHGVEQYFNVHFTKEFSDLTAEEFVDIYLNGLNIRRIVIGEDFHFGKMRSWDTDDLISLYMQRGIAVTVIPLVKEKGEKISSSSIRSLVKQGEMETVSNLYGRPYAINGKVIHGKALGRTLGYPTINLGGDADLYVPPNPGIYLGTAEILGEGIDAGRYNALISAGYRPTVNGQSYSIEAYLLDYSGDLYDRMVSLEFLKYVRDEIKFTDLDQLITQMKLDEVYARDYFG
ncbi:bifunctional riboflavin kinase/FAD synthetase [Paenibacillus sp. GYB006]|uniref:bifunctional riboflavin kinase/FAD synthetase n=1 Tax=Paenibacillus sp. GYB006 TaxID=2994394 RepID=UPI002F9688B1